MSASNNRDVNDFVTNVSPSDSPFFSMIGESTAVARYKENVTDSYSGGTAINALSEGDSFTDEAVAARSVTGNYLQIFSKVINVSETQEIIAKYGGVKSEIDYQVRKKFVELAKDVEYAFMVGTASAGTSGTGSALARKTGGLLTLITTNTATASGASSTGTAFESKLNDLFQKQYENGETPDYVFCAGARKRYISALTSNVTRNVNASEKTQINSINIYDSDFGTVNIILDRYVPATSLFAVKLEMFKAAYLRRFKRVPLAKTSDSTRVAIVGEVTLDVYSELAGGQITFS
jgi:hypothetical protein